MLVPIRQFSFRRTPQPVCQANKTSSPDGLNNVHCVPVPTCSLFAHVPLSADIASQTLLTNPPASGAPALSTSTPARSMAGVA
jgi:hypothetical protein